MTSKYRVEQRFSAIDLEAGAPFLSRCCKAKIAAGSFSATALQVASAAGVQGNVQKRSNLTEKPEPMDRSCPWASAIIGASNKQEAL